MEACCWFQLWNEARPYLIVSQPNRGGINKRSMDEQDTSEDIRKMAHVDVWAALNQLSEKCDKCARNRPSSASAL